MSSQPLRECIKKNNNKGSKNTARSFPKANQPLLSDKKDVTHLLTAVLIAVATALGRSRGGRSQGNHGSNDQDCQSLEGEALNYLPGSFVQEYLIGLQS